MTPEASQMVNDLRVQMAQNLAAGRPSAFGIDIAKLKTALDAIRAPNVRAASAAIKTKKGKSAEKLAELTPDFDEFEKS